MLFRGRSYRHLDSKGRLLLTPEFRQALLPLSDEARFILTNYDGCLVGFPPSAWQEFESHLYTIVNPSRQVRDFRRLVLGGAEEMIPDAQGRIRLSRGHLQYASIEKEVVLMGQGTRFEIWNPERLSSVLEQNFDNVAQEVSSLGLNIGF